jgi:hypothetical protein
MFMQKPLSQRLFDRHLQSHIPPPFAGRVASVESSNPAVEIVERVGPTLQQQLLDLHIADPKLSRRRMDIAASLGALSLEASELIEQAQQERQETLEADLETIRSDGRQQLEIIEALTQDHHQKVNAFMNLREGHSTLTEQIADLKRVRLPRFASKQDRQAHRRKIDNLQKRLSSLTSEVAAAGQEQHRAFEDLEAAQGAMRKISDAEIRCSGALSGQTYRDPEFGLPIASS